MCLGRFKERPILTKRGSGRCGAMPAVSGEKEHKYHKMTCFDRE